MKKLNKKGFTLVELLAVIVVLAVIMLLAVNAVLPQMNKARKNAFITEVEAVIDASKTYYQNEVLLGNTAPTCVDMENLRGKYIDKKDTNFVGKVTISADGTEFKATVTNGQFHVIDAESGSIKEDAVKDGTTTAVTCP